MIKKKDEQGQTPFLTIIISRAISFLQSKSALSDSKQHLQCNQLTNFTAKDRTSVSVSLQLFEFDHSLVCRCMKLASLQVSIHHLRKPEFDQFTDACTVRRALTFFEERACKSIGRALLVGRTEMHRRGIKIRQLRLSSQIHGLHNQSQNRPSYGEKEVNWFSWWQWSECFVF